MTHLSFKPTLAVLIVLLLTPTIYAQGPGECSAKGGTAARCCEHEAYWCHGGNPRARSHCDFCRDVCIKIPFEQVCVWGGTWPSRHEKCYNAIEWYKVCVSIPKDASLISGAYEHVDRSIVISSTETPETSIDELPVKMKVTTRAANKIAERVKDSDDLPAFVKVRRSAVTNQIAFVIELMGEVATALRSALVSNTIESVRQNMNRAVQAIEQLVIQATDLINLIPQTDRGVVKIVVDQWVSAIRVLRVTLRQFIDQGNTIAELKQSAQSILNEISRGFWTKATVALNAYAAFGRFSPDWAPWIEAIRRYFQG